ncbi:hypothetical protein PG993_004171 [Apiospora rasikravindrae]|uniref:Uncharacterized protein n=1 Tax=Apiospora rasikravindrae TaxID=990691 RepID=A0ABR1TC09_9PEZI
MMTIRDVDDEGRRVRLGSRQGNREMDRARPSPLDCVRTVSVLSGIPAIQRHEAPRSCSYRLCLFKPYRQREMGNTSASAIPSVGQGNFRTIWRRQHRSGGELDLVDHLKGPVTAILHQL